MSDPLPILTVVVPCYNERANVAPMVIKLTVALAAIPWEVIFVDDDSPDGTADEVRQIAQQDRRVRCLLRIGRRGLASAVIEGILASSAPYVAVLDGDLQHDETKLTEMLGAVRSGHYDLAVGSRHVEGGTTAGLANHWRHMLSDGGIRLAQALLPVPLSDPMSGYFLVSRKLFEEQTRHLTGQGFKILLDLLLSGRRFRVKEIPYEFRPRVAGESKLDALVLAQFGGLLIDKAVHGVVPQRFISFALVGALGVLVHLAVLTVLIFTWGRFSFAQAIATLVAMVFNFYLNNEITYRDQRLRGPRLWKGLVAFMLVCGLGAIANIGIARSLYHEDFGWSLAGAMGAIVGVVWNYAVSATLVWRRG